MSTGSPRELNFQIWRQFVLEAAIKEPASSTEHHWICYTYNEKRERLISVLPPEKYKELSSKNSFWKIQCEKIPLTEIIAMTQRLARQRVNDLLSFSELTLQSSVDQLFIGNAFLADWKAELLVNKFLPECMQEKEKKAEIAENPLFISALEKMCLRSAAKREALKTEGLWSRFFLLIYLLFNKIPETKNLTIDSPKVQTGSESEIKKKICLMAEQRIKGRIVMNMQGFEENFQEDLILTIEGYKNKNWFKDIQHPNDVKKQWLAFYAEDKISKEKVSQLGNEQRVRIQTLNKLWEDFKKYSESIVDEPLQPQPDSIEPRSDQPQLLQLPQ